MSKPKLSKKEVLQSLAGVAAIMVVVMDLMAPLAFGYYNIGAFWRAPGLANGCTGTETTYHDHGAGTSGDPFILCTPAQLLNLMAATTDLDKSYKLGGNIDLTGRNQSNGAHPIGSSANNRPFSGTFDGNGFKIDHFSYTAGDDAIGLFSMAGGGATIKNLTLANVSLHMVSSDQDIGAIAGETTTSGVTISHCSVSGTVSGDTSGSGIGGIVGWASSDLTVSKSASSISAQNTNGGIVGGIVGVCDQYVHCNISDSYVSGTITGISVIGGFVGFTAGSDYTQIDISNSYFSGSIVAGGDGSAGGFVGRTTSATDGITITNSFVSGSVSCALGRGHGDPNYFPGPGTDLGPCGVIVGSNAGTLGGSGRYYYSAMTLSNDGTQGVNTNSTTGEIISWFNDPLNAPLSAWDFVTTWKSNLGISVLPSLQ